MKLEFYNSNGNYIDEKSIDVQYNKTENNKKEKQFLKDLILTYSANKRQGNACTKTRAEVQGTGKKPWKQKGTGMARHGSKRSPIWRGGGVSGGPKPRSYNKKINKKIKSMGLKIAFLEKMDQGFVKVIESLTNDSYKTKNFKLLLTNIEKDYYKNKKSILIMDNVFEKNIILSSRNLKNVYIKHTNFINALDVIKYKVIIITKSSLDLMLKKINI